MNEQPMLRTWDTVRYQIESNLRALAHWGVTRDELARMDDLARDTSRVLDGVLARVNSPAPQGYDYVIQQNWDASVGRTTTAAGWENVGYEDTLGDAMVNLRAYRDNQPEVPVRLGVECQQCHVFSRRGTQARHKMDCSQR